MRLKLYERAIYGLLCGRIEALIPVCKTYSDYLWAYTSCYIEQEIHSILMYVKFIFEKKAVSVIAVGLKFETG